MTPARIRRAAAEILGGTVAGGLFLCMVVGFFVILERILGALS